MCYPGLFIRVNRFLGLLELFGFLGLFRVIRVIRVIRVKLIHIITVTQTVIPAGGVTISLVLRFLAARLKFAYYI